MLALRKGVGWPRAFAPDHLAGGAHDTYEQDKNHAVTNSYPDRPSTVEALTLAKRGQEGMAKRAREQARQVKQEAKNRRRELLQQDAGAKEDGPDEAALMAEFAQLSEKHAAGLISDNVLLEGRRRIFLELGIESD